MSNERRISTADPHTPPRTSQSSEEDNQSQLVDAIQLLHNHDQHPQPLRVLRHGPIRVEAPQQDEETDVIISFNGNPSRATSLRKPSRAPSTRNPPIGKKTIRNPSLTPSRRPGRRVTNPKTHNPENASSSSSPINTWTSTPLDPVVVFPWSRRIEEYLSHLANICKRSCDLHSASYHHYRRWGYIWSIPPIVIPLVFSPLIPVLKSMLGSTCHDTDIADILTMIGFIATSVTSSISSYFGFGALATLHETFAAKYSDLHTDIEAMFLPPKKFRQPPEVFLTSLRIRYAHLVASEPNIPLSVLRVYQHKPDSSPAFVTSEL